MFLWRNRNLNICLNDHKSGILQQRTHDEELKKYCVTLLEKFGSLSYTRQTLEELDVEARAEVATHGGNRLLEDVLNELLEWKKWNDENKPAHWESEDCGKCVITQICSMGILYVANSLQCLLLYVILFMLNNMYMTQKSMLWISTVIFFCLEGYF